MKTLKVLCVLILLPVIHYSCSNENPELKVTGLKCEYLVSPLGIDVMAPRLSWKIEAVSDRVFNKQQKAYQILVASSPEQLSEELADLWNSGRVESQENAQIVYRGAILNSGQKCYWKVKVWDEGNDYTQWSGIAYWGVGLLDESDWKAKWIGAQPDLAQKAYREYLDQYDPQKMASLKNVRPFPPASPMLRKKFTVKPAVRDALLYVSALGYYEIGINGKKAGDQVLAPEWTDYGKRVQYQVYEVSKDLRDGENVLSSILGDGWYLGMLGPTKWHADYPRRGVYGNDRRLIARLVINYQDGTSQAVLTDESWKINTNGFIISADNFLGQKIDARNIPRGWQDVDFDDASWENAYVDTAVKMNLVAQKNEPVRVYKHLSPVNISPFGNKYIVDFGQNITGWTRLMIRGEKGDLIKIRHGEMLDDDGSLYTINLAAAVQEDEYILSGGQDVFEPVFTYHGFRYIEISGLKAAPVKEMITACAISSDPEVTGSFECSNPKLNQLWSNIIWTQRDNMTSIPTDCPQRDERMGWMGDAQVFCQNSIFNMDMAAFYSKWIKDIRDAQSERGTFPDIAPHNNKPDIRFSNAPAWADAGIIVPWRIFQNYGDTVVLLQHYDAMKRYLENIRKQNPDFIWVNDVGHSYGDWLNANTVIADGYSNTRGQVPNDVFATAFYANSARLLSQIANVLGKEGDAEGYLLLFENIRTKFNDAFVDSEGKIKGDTQSAYALALNFDLLPEILQEPAFKHMIRCIEEYDYRISTGFITTIMLMKELTKRGRNDIAYTLMESERFPSWIYSINQGATTIWERWDGYVKGRGFQNPGMNSFCHYSIGSVGEWMYRVIAGINPDDHYPGYRHFIIHPRPGGSLTWAKGSYQSIHGLISSAWKKRDGIFSLDIEIPVNTSATVILPAGSKELIRINAKSVSPALINKESNGGNETAIELGSGKYSIDVTGKKRSPADYVNPFIGASTSIGKAGVLHGLGKTFPGAATPFGLVQVSPNTITGGDNGPGYSYEHKTIEGFAFTQMSGIGWYGDLGNFLVMPSTGPMKTNSGKETPVIPGYRSTYEKAGEQASAGYYSVHLSDYDIKAEATAAPHSGMLRFTFPENKMSRIQIDLARRVGGTSTEQYVKVVDQNTIEGWMKCTPEGGGWGNGGGKPNYTVFFYAQFSKRLINFGVWSADIPDGTNRKREFIESEQFQKIAANAEILKQCREKQGKHIGFYSEFPSGKGETVLMKVGISFVSIDGARKNLEADITGWDFDQVKNQSMELWNQALSKIKIEGGTEEEKVVFYTALYHTLIDPRAFADVDGKYPGGDGEIKQTGNFTKRTIFSGWDVFRSQFPLQTIINPSVVNDMINSLVELADQNGTRYLERWEFLNAYSGCMLGNPAVSMIVDAYSKGIRNFDVAKAYEYSRNSVEKFGNGERGYSEDISTTLEHAYSEWCMAEFARQLGKSDDENQYRKRSQSYRNIFDPSVGWFRPKANDGSWEPWPAKGRLEQGYGSVESNPYQQGWFVPHDVDGLAGLLGGREKAIADLTEFFEKSPENMMWNDYYNHPNEPVHQVPFLFNRLGVPWLTQKWTREICRRAYHNSVEGLVGNEDVGQMSAWYVLAASGLHPVCPGETRYEITSPVFDRIEIHLDPQYAAGKTFTIIARNNSAANIYIQSAKLNGKPYDQCWISHEVIAEGGTLELEMGSEPAPFL